VPPEFAGKPDDYVDLVVDEQLPQAARRGLPGHGPPFCDVFCDEGAFTADQTRRILGRAAELGMPRKLHADEFGDLGAARLAAELRATSADHLVTTPAETLPLLRQAGTIAVLLPGTTFGLGSLHYADARALVEAGVAVALGTDLNPGTCWCESMPLIIALGVRYLGLSVSEAVVAATRNAAYACGRGDTAGRIEVGYPADLIVLDFRDYRHLAYRFGASPVRAVMIHGRWVWPSEDGPS
jgi:imidazolonepropionase